jgi:hypothetical protein
MDIRYSYQIQYATVYSYWSPNCDRANTCLPSFLTAPSFFIYWDRIVSFVVRKTLILLTSIVLMQTYFFLHWTRYLHVSKLRHDDTADFLYRFTSIDMNAAFLGMLNVNASSFDASGSGHPFLLFLHAS